VAVAEPIRHRSEIRSVVALFEMHFAAIDEVVWRAGRWGKTLRELQSTVGKQEL
jgi:hypothetical protein